MLIEYKNINKWSCLLHSHNTVGDVVSDWSLWRNCGLQL